MTLDYGTQLILAQLGLSKEEGRKAIEILKQSGLYLEPDKVVAVWVKRSEGKPWLIEIYLEGGWFVKLYLTKEKAEVDHPEWG